MLLLCLIGALCCVAALVVLSCLQIQHYKERAEFWREMFLNRKR